MITSHPSIFEEDPREDPRVGSPANPTRSLRLNSLWKFIVPTGIKQDLV